MEHERPSELKPDSRTQLAPGITYICNERSEAEPLKSEYISQLHPQTFLEKPRESCSICLKPGCLCQSEAEAQLTVSRGQP